MIPKLYDPGEPDPSPRLTVSTLVDRYLADRQRHLKGGLCSAALYDRLNRYLSSFAEAKGDEPADGLRASDVTAWILEHEAWASDHTRQDAARSVVAMFRWATDEERLLDRNPVPRVKPCWRKPQPRGAILPAEYQAIMDLARNCNGVRRGPGRRARPSRGAFRVAMFFLWETGARTCEMRTAQWQHIDWKLGVVRLAVNKTAWQTGQVRVVPLSPRLLRLLNWIKRWRLHKPNDEIFLSGRRTAWTKDTFGRLFRQFANLAGIRPEVTAYSLRHGFCVRGLQAGVGDQQLADVMGHTTTKYIAWYGKDAKDSTAYLRDTLEQVHGRKPRPKG